MIRENSISALVDLFTLGDEFRAEVDESNDRTSDAERCYWIHLDVSRRGRYSSLQPSHLIYVRREPSTEVKRAYKLNYQIT